MVQVEGGTYTMGCTSEQTNCSDNEKPAHSVTLSNFSIGKYEVTRAQWVAVMEGHATLANPGTWKDDDQLPIEMVSWDDICGKDGFLDRLNTLTGKSYRLPTEAEWEYAARGCKGSESGGNATCENFLYSGSNDANEVGWHKGNSLMRTQPVGQKKPNRLGIYDMSGNLWEWVYDRYAVYTNAAATNPTVPPTAGSICVVRGGCLDNIPPTSYRVASRGSWFGPTDRRLGVGFRLALP
jgi:formylglycine-generating enzyme required for sulfatase activity